MSNAFVIDLTHVIYQKRSCVNNGTSIQTLNIEFDLLVAKVAVDEETARLQEKESIGVLVAPLEQSA